MDIRPENTLKSLQKFSECNDIRRVRRALSNEDSSQLIEAARTGDSYLNINGEEWTRLFRMAAETGFRWNELRSLKRGQLAGLDTEHPCLSISAENTKNGKSYTQPLIIDTARLLDSFFKLKLHSADAFNLPKYNKGANAIQHYLAITQDENNDPIPYRDESGRVFDFHALRVQFTTRLARAGVSLAAARELMHHSAVDLSAKHYAHYSLEDRRDALNKLPEYSNTVHKTAKMTSTNDTSKGIDNTLQKN